MQPKGAIFLFFLEEKDLSTRKVLKETFGNVSGNEFFGSTINYNKESAEKIIEKIEFAIEQHPSFLKVNPVKNLNKSL